MPDLFILGAIFVTAFGLSLGSFANVVIYRLPNGQNVITPRSKCPKCNQFIKWYDNIPIFAWLFLKGKCRNCKAKISFRYPLVEFIMGTLFLAIYLKYGWSFLTIEYLILVFGLVTISFIDMDHFIIPDSFSLGGIIIGLLGGWLNPERPFMDSLVGMLVGGGFLWLIAYLYWIFRKEEGMGGGDIKLLAWIGAVLGWGSVPFVILLSSILGSILGLILSIKSETGLKSAIPFGPYLALAAIVYVLGGNQIAQWYIGLFIPGFSFN